MADPTFVGILSQTNAGGGGGATFVRLYATNNYPAATLTLTNTAGATLIVGISGAGASDTTSVADTKSDSYTLRSFASLSTTGILRVFTTTGISAGVNVITFTSTLTDVGVFAVMYSGASTFDVGASNGATGLNTLLTTNTTTGTDMGFVAWADENNNTYLTNVVFPGPIVPVSVSSNLSHWDRQFEILNGGSGIASGTYTNRNTNSANTAGLVTIFLKP